MLIRVLVSLLVMTSSACSLLKDKASEVGSTVSACTNIDIESLKTQNTIPEECRSSIKALLGQDTSNFGAGILAMGSEIDEYGRPVVYLQGVDSSGNAISQIDYETATYAAVTGETETEISHMDVTVTPLETSSEDVISLGIVTDYSGSMADADLDKLAEVHTELLNGLPSIFESEVVLFSDTVTTQQELTSDLPLLLSAVARNATYTRGGTALYDGMGASATRIAASTRPVRVLVVATDGLENASTAFTREQLIELVDDSRLFVIMIGSLFADVEEMKALKGDQGLFFYVNSFDTLKANMASFIGTFKKMVRVELPAEHGEAEKIKITIGTATTEVTLRR